MDRELYEEREALVAQILNEMLDASIDGDFKLVKKLAKKIYKLGLESQMAN